MPIAHRAVLSYGNFDRFGPTEIDFLRRLSRLGDEVVIGCLTDACCADMGERIGGSFETRKERLESCRYVDRVIATDNLCQRRTDIVNYNISVFAMADHWQGKFDDLHDITNVLYLPSMAPVKSGDCEQIQIFALAG